MSLRAPLNPMPPAAVNANDQVTGVLFLDWDFTLVDKDNNLLDEELIAEIFLTAQKANVAIHIVTARNRVNQNAIDGITSGLNKLVKYGVDPSKIEIHRILGGEDVDDNNKLIADAPSQYWTKKSARIKSTLRACYPHLKPQDCVFADDDKNNADYVAQENKITVLLADKTNWHLDELLAFVKEKLRTKLEAKAPQQIKTNKPQGIRAVPPSNGSAAMFAVAEPLPDIAPARAFDYKSAAATPAQSKTEAKTFFPPISTTKKPIEKKDFGKWLEETLDVMYGQCVRVNQYEKIKVLHDIKNKSVKEILKAVEPLYDQIVLEYTRKKRQVKTLGELSRSDYIACAMKMTGDLIGCTMQERYIGVILREAQKANALRYIKDGFIRSSISFLADKSITESNFKFSYIPVYPEYTLDAAQQSKHQLTP